MKRLLGVMLLTAVSVIVVSNLTVDRGNGAQDSPTQEAASAPEVPALATGTPVAADEPWTLGSIALTHGVASGDVSSTGANLWARANKRGRMYVELATSPAFRVARRHVGGIAAAADDYAVTLRVRKLRPGTRYHYRIWFAEGPGARLRSRPVAGTFRTAPGASDGRATRFVFGGDIGSGGYCRNEKYGYPIFAFMDLRDPDFFVSLGDAIYADSDCPRSGPDGWPNLPAGFADVEEASVDWTDAARVREIYFDHWRYTRADRQLRNFLGTTPIYSMWDDHEVMNDFGARWNQPNVQYGDRPGFKNLVAAGRRGLFAYGVLSRRRRDPNRLYRFYRLGKHLQLVLTDTRSYRSRDEQRDEPGRRKTMLGAAQLAWLKRSLAFSTATWKVVATSVPISVPTGSTDFGRDGWADGGSESGYERELLDLLEFLDGRNVKNVVFITADLHFAQATRNSRDYDGDGDRFVFHELIAGPLNARMGAPYGVDETTRPTTLYAEGGFFNFGLIRIFQDKRGQAILRAETVDAYGKTRPRSVLFFRPL